MNSRDELFIKQRQSLFAIPLDTILFMEKSNRTITIHIRKGEDICFYGKYDSVLPMLDERFVHPHRTYVINMQHIYRLGNQEVVMMGGQMIKMGGRCFARLKREYDAYVKKHIRGMMER